MTRALEAVREPVPRAGTEPLRGRPRAEVRPALSVVPRPYSRRVAVFVALAIVGALLTAVVFHVVLAQGQLQLDQLDRQIDVERREYEKRRLEAAVLSSPQRIMQEAQRIGLEAPQDPPTYLEVPGAPTEPAGTGETSTTLGEWKKVKSHLGDAP
jgi:cell division protein FtsL